MDLKLRTEREKNILNSQKVNNRGYCLLYYRQQDVIVKYESQPCNIRESTPGRNIVVRETHDWINPNMHEITC